MALAATDFGVVIALAEEFDRFRRFFALSSDPPDSGEGLLFQVTDAERRQRTGVVTVVKSMGLSDATAATTRLIDDYRPALVVSIGIAGSLSSYSLLGSVVIGTEADDYAYQSKAVTDPANPDVIGFAWCPGSA